MLRVALLALAVYSALADGHAHTESCSVPAFTWWRVVNAERLDDHWNIGELEMFEPDGVDVRLADKIISVVSSFNYGQHQDLVGSYLINHTNQ